MKEHHYLSTITWTGNTGQGTKAYTAYERDHTIQVAGKPEIPGTSEVSVRGSLTRYNPEEMLLSALSACHMLWYLHLCSVNKVIVTAYIDKAEGTMAVTPDGSGQFTEVTLKPEITISGKPDEALLEKLHYDTNKLCNIARSVNFQVHHEAVYTFND
ncbi:OsmC family protein [Mucilaginibacter rivuli]|uniref:OsmC family protein n=1 Tax=Mucilaginibacter rivuli TaxID=2857527 RepID=UPI00210321D4|nr:OsmC family protein [Mucilaginibacter rivuli]